MHLYLIRHGDPCYNPDSLTSTGWKEAEALAPRLRDLGTDRLYSSQKVRAKETGIPTSSMLNLPITELPWLNEKENLRITQDSGEYMVWDTYGEDLRQGNLNCTLENWSFPPSVNHDELLLSWKGFRGEADRFIASLGYIREKGRYRVIKPNNTRAALFCHNGTILFFLAHLLEIPLSLAFSGFFLWPSSLTDIYFDQRSGQWAVPRALCVSDVSHLAVRNLKPQARGMGDRCDEYY